MSLHHREVQKNSKNARFARFFEKAAFKAAMKNKIKSKKVAKTGLSRGKDTILNRRRRACHGEAGASVDTATPFMATNSSGKSSGCKPKKQRRQVGHWCLKHAAKKRKRMLGITTSIRVAFSDFEARRLLRRSARHRRQRAPGTGPMLVPSQPRYQAYLLLKPEIDLCIPDFLSRSVRYQSISHRTDRTVLSGNRFAAFEVSAVRGPLNPLPLSLPALQLLASEMLNSLLANPFGV